MHPVSLAAFSNISPSIGFIENMSNTLQDIPSCCKDSAASSAILTVIPHAAIVQSEPSRIVIPLPIWKSWDSE